MPELLVLKFLLCVCAAYLIGLLQITPPSPPPCWLSTEPPHCWAFAASPAGSVRHER